MIRFKSIFLLLIFFIAIPSWARVIELEFEKVDDAVTYQFEFRKESETEILKKITQGNNLVEIDLPFDHYEYRQRALDIRNVPGEWSTWEKFVVTVPELKITAPVMDAEIKSDQSKETVQIQWQGAEGIQKFKVTIEDLISKKLLVEEIVEGRSLEFSIPAGSLFQARVQTMLGNPRWPGLETSTEVRFAVQAGALDAAEMQTEKNKFMRVITWSKDPLAEFYDILLERYSPSTKKWIVVYENKNLKSNQLELNSNWSGGNYRFKVISKAKYRKDSVPRIEKFFLASDRSPAAEYNESVTRAIDRINGYYSQVSWLVTQLGLSSNNLETNTQASAKPLGGTLRAGFGYFKYDSSWGVSSYLNTTRMTLNNQNKDFAGFELNGVYRTRFSYRDELRLSLGLTDLQVPVLIGDSRAGEFNVSKVNVLGPKVAVEYWYSLGPKFGLQANFVENFYNVIKNSSSPNGNALRMPVSFQTGIMASYRFTSQITGLLGLQHQEENYQYEAMTRAGPQPISSGSNNNGALKADSIGLMVEIGL